MMSIIKLEPRMMERWDPFSELERWFDPFFFSRPIVTETFWHPATDIVERDDSIIVRMDLPGVDGKDIEITFDGHLLTIEGERKEEMTGTGNGYYSRERLQGRFHRILHLPATVSNDGLRARYHQGVLEIEVPKREEAKRKAIEIEIAE